MKRLVFIFGLLLLFALPVIAQQPDPGKKFKIGTVSDTEIGIFFADKTAKDEILGRIAKRGSYQARLDGKGNLIQTEEDFALEELTAFIRDIVAQYRRDAAARAAVDAVDTTDLPDKKQAQVEGGDVKSIKRP